MALQEESGVRITPLGAGIVAILALIAGFAAGGYFSGYGGTGGAPQYLGFTNDDKNFLVTIANLQSEQITTATATQSATLDWCTANGGVWVRDQSEATLNLTSEQAQELSQQGANVQQNPNGTYSAQVIVVDYGNCVLIPTGTGG